MEIEAEQAVRACVPRLNTAQETWYSLAALKERVASTASIARERMRNADNDPGETRVGRDPDELEREADAVAAQEAELAREVAPRGQALTEASRPAERDRGRPPAGGGSARRRWSGPPPTGARGWPG